MLLIPTASSWAAIPAPSALRNLPTPHGAARLGVTGGLHYDSFLRTEDDENYVLAIFAV